jgi:hypothetical protein
MKEHERCPSWVGLSAVAFLKFIPQIIFRDQKELRQCLNPCLQQHSNRGGRQASREKRNNVCSSEVENYSIRTKLIFN